MTKVVINRCYGGFDLSPRAKADIEMLSGGKVEAFNIPRDNQYLVQIVEELGNQASGSFSDLQVITIPDDVDWIVQDYDGMEWVAERHRTWC